MSDFFRLLVVCEANQARSPLAAALLRRSAEESGWTEETLKIRSAGVNARGSAPALASIQTSAFRLGVDLSRHSARQLTAADVDTQDLIITMTEAQRTQVSRSRPQGITRTFTLREIARLTAGVDPVPRDLRSRASALHRARVFVPSAKTGEDVDDPSGATSYAARRIANELQRLSETTSRYLFATHA